MIVALCGTDLLKLVNGEKIVVGDNVIVQQTAKDESFVHHETNASAEEYREDALGRRTDQSIRERRNATRDKIVGKAVEDRKAPRKMGQRWMKAIYPGGCYMNGCPNAWKKGALILYDYDTRRALCEGHGESEFPNIPKPGEVKA